MSLCTRQAGDGVSDSDGWGHVWKAAGRCSRDEQMASVSTHLSTSPGCSKQCSAQQAVQQQSALSQAATCFALAWTAHRYAHNKFEADTRISGSLPIYVSHSQSMCACRTGHGGHARGAQLQGQPCQHQPQWSATFRARHRIPSELLAVYQGGPQCSSLPRSIVVCRPASVPIPKR